MKDAASRGTAAGVVPAVVEQQVAGDGRDTGPP
jgi:hypothetical protein